MDERELRASPSAPVVAVLAGGLGRRMGAAKATVELAGRPLISYPLRAAADAGLPALVVAKSDSELPPLQAPVVREPDGPRHPLCGVLAALRHAGASDGEPRPPGGERAHRERRPGHGRASAGRGVLAVACDMPFLSAGLLAWMAEMGETAVATVDGRVQPLPALWSQAARPALEQALARGDSLRAALALLRARSIDERELHGFGDPRRMFLSVNDASDLRLAEGWLRD